MSRLQIIHVDASPLLSTQLSYINFLNIPYLMSATFFVVQFLNDVYVMLNMLPNIHIANNHNFAKGLKNYEISCHMVHNSLNEVFLSFLRIRKSHDCFCKD